MKAITLAIALLAAAPSFGQGQIYFNNRTPTGDARVTFCDGSGAGAGFTAALFLSRTTGDLNSNMLLPTTTFRTGLAASFFVNPVVVTVPGVPAGASVEIFMGVWADHFGSPAAAARILGFCPYFGRSNSILIPQLGGIPAGGSPPIPTPGLSGLQGFSVAPEPSVSALAILAALGLYSFNPRRPRQRA